MRLLILGGTLFLGRHIVESALGRGHDVTLFNRGQTNPTLFPGVEQLRGERDGGLQALEGRRWDAVVDTSGYVPRIVRQSVECLRDAVDHYTFISSISVYPDISIRRLTEDAATATLEDPTVEEVTGESYGALKALCEQEVLGGMPGRSLIVRAGLLVGPHDPTGRFTYWVRRIAEGGEVLVPGEPERRVQVIDARDVATWIVEMAETRTTGTYNATGPGEPLTMQEWMEQCRNASGSDARLTWVSEAFLLARGVTPWTDLPLWLPSGTEGLLDVSIDRALATGLRFRPLEETIRDTLEWIQAIPPEAEGPEQLASSVTRTAGMSREREAMLLREWHEQQEG